MASNMLKHQWQHSPTDASANSFSKHQGPHSSRRASALRAVLWGFSDLHMEAQHRANLHRPSSTSIPAMLVLTVAIACVDVLRILVAGESLLQTSACLVGALGYLLLYYVSAQHPQLYNTYPEAWPVVLLCARLCAIGSVAMSLPMRDGLHALLTSEFGRLAVTGVHVCLPAILQRTRLLLSCLTYTSTAAMLCWMELVLGCSLPKAVLWAVLPCSGGLLWTVYCDYKGRLTLLCRSSGQKPAIPFSHPASATQLNTYKQPHAPTVDESAFGSRTSTDSGYIGDLMSVGPVAGERTLHNDGSAVGCVVSTQKSNRTPGFKYCSRIKGSTISFKLNNAHPHQLPPDWLDSVNQAVADEFQQCLIGVTVREGCIEVVLDIRPGADNSQSFALHLNGQAASTRIAQIVTELLPTFESPSLPAPTRTADDAIPSRSAIPMCPVLTQLTPCVMQLPSRAHTSRQLTLSFTAVGANLLAPGIEVLVTCQGRHVPVAVTALPVTGDSIVSLACPLSALPRGAGMLQVFARLGNVSSDPCMLLLLPDAAMVSELSHLPGAAESEQELQDILCDLGQWTDVVQGRLAVRANSRGMQPWGSQEIATGSVDMSGQLAELLVLRGVERAMVPTAIDLLHFFCNLDLQHCACAMLSDLLNADLGWSVGPDEMWRHLNTPGSQPLLDMCESGPQGLAKRLAAIAESAGCDTSHGRSSSSVAQSHSHVGYAPGAEGCTGAASSSFGGQVSSGCGEWHAEAGGGLNRRTSALRALLWGFPDPQMEARHRAALHRANSSHVNQLFAMAAVIAVVECLQVVRAGQGPVYAACQVAWSSTHFLEWCIRKYQPNTYDAYPEAWQLLALVRLTTLSGIPAGLPVRSGLLAVLRQSTSGLILVLLHVLVPAMVEQTRLPLGTLIWAARGFVVVWTALSVGHSLPWALLCQLVPCLLGFFWSVHRDYQGRAALLKQEAKIGKKVL